jgi:hypothetical protein
MLKVLVNSWADAVLSNRPKGSIDRQLADTKESKKNECEPKKSPLTPAFTSMVPVTPTHPPKLVLVVVPVGVVESSVASA